MLCHPRGRCGHKTIMADGQTRNTHTQSVLGSILHGALLSPFVHDLNLPLLEVLCLGAGPEEGGEAQEKAVSHGWQRTKMAGCIRKLAGRDENWFLRGWCVRKS